MSFGATKNINYIYDASGTKLKKVVNDNGTITTTSYAGNYVYENDALQFFNQPEGYVEPVSAGSTNFAYVYQYKDHLGNVRLSYSDSNGDGVITPTGLGAEIREENNYYPFGLKHKGYNNVQNGRDHKFGFGNKEEQDELGLSWIDITARNYDPALGRWMNVDPLAEQMRRHSPYNYAFDNPLRFTDPDGMLPDDIIIEGSKEFRMKALGRLQALTNDQLKIRSDGTVVITSLGTKNTGKALNTGTNLIRRLNSKDPEVKTTTIVEISGGNVTNSVPGGKPLLKSDSTANSGADAVIGFNPSKTTGGVDQNGNTTRPTEIGLGHELGHAENINNGVVDMGSSGKTDPDGSGKTLSNEEVNARSKENELRKEQNITLRKVPK